MAEETVDKCVEVCRLNPTSGCLTKGLLLDGAYEWSPTLFIRLIQDFGLDHEVKDRYVFSAQNVVRIDNAAVVFLFPSLFLLVARCFGHYSPFCVVVRRLPSTLPAPTATVLSRWRAWRS